MQTPTACRLYNIPLHRAGLEAHPISLVEMPDEGIQGRVNRTIPDISRGEYGPFI
jgi:hypothetical protein